MSKEEAIEYGNFWLDMNKDSKNSNIYEFFRIAIKALEQESIQNMPPVTPVEKHEPCIDMISREAALKCFTLNNTKADSWNNIKALPPITLQPKTGHWEWEQEPFTKNWGNWRCSECRELITVCETEWAEINKPNYKYCFNCGTKMSEKPTDSEKE